MKYMSGYNQSVQIEVDLDVEHELEVDADGILSVVAFLYTNEDEEAYEARTPIEDIVDNLIDYYSEDLTREGYSQMYRVGNEMRRLADRLIEAAESQEDLVHGGGQLNLFDEDEDAVEEGDYE